MLRSSLVFFVFVFVSISLCSAGEGGPSGSLHNPEILLHTPGLLVFRSGMTVEADGSPHAYSPIPGQGLDSLNNAGHPGDWDGILTLDGKPVLQGEDDSAPGYYISQTALEDESQPAGTQRRFVNAEKVPFISLPGEMNGPALGDVALVFNTHNGLCSPAILADQGPTLGEGSIALAKRLGVEPDARSGGAYAGLVYVVFENSGTGDLIGSEAMARVAKESYDSSEALQQLLDPIVDVSQCADLDPGSGKQKLDGDESDDVSSAR